MVELTVLGFAVGGLHAAGGHHLDQVDTMLVLPSDDRRGLVRVGGLAPPEVAVALDRGDRLAGAFQPRPDDLPGVDAVSKLEFQPIAATQVPGGGDAMAHHGLGTADHLVPDVGIGLHQLVGQRRDRWVEHHVHVSIDQAREDGHAGKVLPRQAPADRDDGLPFHDDRVERRVALGDAVPKADVGVGGQRRIR